MARVRALCDLGPGSDTPTHALSLQGVQPGEPYLPLQLAGPSMVATSPVGYDSATGSVTCRATVMGSYVVLQADPGVAGLLPPAAQQQQPQPQQLQSSQGGAAGSSTGIIVGAAAGGAVVLAAAVGVAYVLHRRRSHHVVFPSHE